MKKVLIITYYWPPAGGSGVQRWLKFSKYLGEFGWEPIIVTTKKGTYPLLDPSLEADVPKGLKVHKTSSLEYLQIFSMITGNKNPISVGMIGISESKSSFITRMGKYIRANFLLPDARKGWNNYAYKKAAKIIKSENIDIIITTGPPHSTHLVGQKLKKNFNVKWIADFRDPWVNIYYNKYLPRTEQTIEKDIIMEREVITGADKVITVSKLLKLDLERHNGSFEVIYNGYDQEDIYETDTLFPKEKFSISHIGNFIRDYDCESLWNSILEMEKKYPGFGDHFELSFTGPVDSVAIESLNKFNLMKYIRLSKYVAHKEATQIMWEASLLLFIIPRDKNNKLIISGKIFEYIAARTPILSIGPIDGEIALILQNIGREPMADYEDQAGIMEVIEKYYKLWLEAGKIQFKHESGETEQFSRRSLTKQLSTVLNEVSDVITINRN